LASPGTGSAKLPRSARLTQSREFDRVFKDASRVRDRYFTILYRYSPEEQPRLGMAVSRRTAPKATDRSRIKRLIRETFRQRQYRLAPYDIVVIAKAPARHASRSELQGCLGCLWERLARQ
jgi:ribonuclease P protein component